MIKIIFNNKSINIKTSYDEIELFEDDLLNILSTSDKMDKIIYHWFETMPINKRNTKNDIKVIRQHELRQRIRDSILKEKDKMAMQEYKFHNSDIEEGDEYD